MRRLAGSITFGAALVLAAACSDTSGFEGPAAATPGVEATIRLAEAIQQHIASTPVDYSTISTRAVEAFGVAGALAAAGDADRAKPFESASALAADELATSAVAGTGIHLSDDAKQRIVDEASAASYDEAALTSGLERLVAALLWADTGARAALAGSASTFEAFAASSGVSEVAKKISARVVDNLRENIRAGSG